MRGGFLEEVTHLKGWTYRSPENVSACPQNTPSLGVHMALSRLLVSIDSQEQPRSGEVSLDCTELPSPFEELTCS